MAEDQNCNDNNYLIFTLNGENYALPVTDILEVLLVPEITQIPRMPDFMRGVFNLRGAVIPVLDLRRKFGMEETRQGISAAIIVIEIPAAGSEANTPMLRLGVFADAVNNVIRLDENDIDSPPKIGARIETSFIKGIGLSSDSFMIILDMQSILSYDDIELIENVKEVV